MSRDETSVYTLIRLDAINANVVNSFAKISQNNLKVHYANSVSSDTNKIIRSSEPLTYNRKRTFLQKLTRRTNLLLEDKEISLLHFCFKLFCKHCPIYNYATSIKMTGLFSGSV